MLDEEFDYYDAHQPDIVKGHLGEWVVIKNLRVQGYFSNEEDAFDAMKDEELGTFLLKRCQEPGTDIANCYNDTVSFA